MIVVTLALAIGGSTAIFTVVHGVLLRPLQFPDSERLVLLWQRAPGVGVDEDWFSPAQYFDLRERVESLESVAIFGGRSVTLTAEELEPERLGAVAVSSSFFEVLGIAPVLGRALNAEDDDPEGADVKVLISQRLFRQRFGADPGIVGQRLTVDGQRLEVVGVLPPVPLDSGVLPTLRTIPVFDLVLSMPMEDPQKTTRGSENYNIVGRLSPEADRARLDTELLEVARHFAADPGALGAGLEAGSELRIGVVGLLAQVVGDMRRPLWILLGATGLLLMIACANVANLLHTRSAARVHELGLRAALGASRGRLVVVSLLEGVLLAGVGGLLGLLSGIVALRALRAYAPVDLPRVAEIAIDPIVVLYVAGLSILAACLFAVGPAMRASGASPAGILRASATTSAAALGAALRGSPPHRGRRHGGSRRLVVVQVALSLVLTAAGGLLLRTFWQLQRADLGFEPSGVLSFRLSLVGDEYSDVESRVRFFERLWPRLRALPGVESAGGASLLPLTRGYAWTDFLVEGFNSAGDENRVVADVMISSPGYFEAMGVRLRSGRTFADADGRRAREAGGGGVGEGGAGNVVVVNRAFAERFWPIDEAVGKWVQTDFSEQATIVGVVDTIRQYGADAETRLAVFFPHAAFGSRTLYGVLRSETDPLALTASLERVVHELDPDLPVYDVRSMAERSADALAVRRAVMLLLCLFAALALALSSVGLYGVLAFAVATQHKEIGIRAALGAQRGDLYRWVLSGAAVVTGLGVTLGILGGVVASRGLRALVYGVAPTDPLSFAAATAIVLAVAALASWIPARRAAAVDPIETLRADL